MSWHYSQALVAAYSAANCSDGRPSVALSGSPTPQAFLSPDRMKAFSRLSRFGMTCEPLTDDFGEAVLTWFLAGFPARTYPPQEKAQELTGHEAECGTTWPESFAKWHPATSSWKTRQCSLLEGLDEFSETWPRWGMMRDGECWEQPTPSLITDLRAQTTSEIESGSLERWPTPRSCSAMAANITQESAWNGSRFPNLETIVGRKRWPTPSANEDAAGTPKGNMQKMLGNHPMIRGTTPEQWATGTLNPTWTEWLMGWPLGWTDLKPLETDKFPQWRHSHGKPSHETSETVTTFNPNNQ